MKVGSFWWGTYGEEEEEWNEQNNMGEGNDAGCGES